ncbi:MAG: TonB family protein [bacterium]|nr:TonB family protein [bacterium]
MLKRQNREKKVPIINKNFLSEDEIKTKEYRLPNLVTSKPEVIPIGKSFAISTFLHPTAVALIWFISIILALAGIHLFEFGKIKPQKKSDIEFVLVDKPAPPRDPNTKNRSDMNSRSGGVRDPKRALSLPSSAPKKVQQKPSSATNKANQLIKKQQQQSVQKKVTTQQPPKQVSKPAKNTEVSKPSPAKPVPPNARPSARPVSAPTPVAKPSTPFNIPAPTGATPGKTLSTGPIGGTSSPTGSARTGSGVSVGSTGSYGPRPSLAPSMGGGSGQLSRGSSAGGNGTVGNPGGGGGAPGIDALREPDFGPYMRELQRRIKLNWDPPKGNESKTVVLLFKIAKDGRLLSCRIHRSSGLPSADQAALKAVELTAPFRPLPADFKGQNIDIQFTFDYRVFGASRY